MKIGLNGQYILIKDPAGPERFTINLYKSLARNDNTNEYVIYFNAKPDEDFFNDLTGGNNNFTYKVVSSFVSWTQFGLALELFKNSPDVVFSPIHTIPFFRSRRTKFITMIHGLEYKTNENFNRGSLKALIHTLVMYWTTVHSDKIVVPSNATKENLLKQNWLKDDSKIEIIHEGVSNDFFNVDINEAIEVAKRYELEYKKYLLFVSTIQPRKNIPNLIKAFSVAAVNKDIKLILVGKLGWKYDEALNAPKKYAVENKVRFLSWIDQSDLPKLMAGALGYVNFSKDEGFGLTVLETMASNIPTSVSDIPAHHEVGGNYVLFANPDDVEDIAKNVEILIDQSYPVEYLDSARKRAQKFTWDNTARKLINLFEHVKQS